MSEHRKTTISKGLPAWEAYLQQNPTATLFHDPRWGQVMEAAYGNRTWYVTAEHDGRTTGVLQLVAQKSLLFGSHLCSLPYADAAGVLADDEATALLLVCEAERLRQELGADWAELRQAAPLPKSPPSRTDKVTFRLSLPGSPEGLWEGLKPKVRNQIRKAERAGLTAGQGGGELLAEFYQVYCLCMRNLGSPSHGRRFFQALFGTFGQAARLFVVRLESRAIAASFTLSDRNGVYVPWAASDWRHSALCPNMLLYWEMLADSCRRRARYFDFGRSTRDSGTYQFKKQWGPQEMPLHWHYLLAPGRQMPDLRPDSRKYRLLAACWRRLPVWLTRAVGPAVIGRLS